MRVLHIAAEAGPWTRTGGLGDVLGALPAAQQRVAPTAQVGLLMPLHRDAAAYARSAGIDLLPAGEVRFRLGDVDLLGRVLRADREGAATFLLDIPSLYDRVRPYDDAQRQAWPDNPLRFAALARAAVEVAPRLLGGTPDVLHWHDWHAALGPVYADQQLGGPVSRSVLTVHNLGYQGVCDKSWVPALDLDWRDFHIDGLEFYDQLNMLKGGITSADATTTVSPTFARQMQTEEFGRGLHDFVRLRARRLTGILNGLDTDEWDPAQQPALPAGFDIDDLAGKAACRRALLTERGLDPDSDDATLVVVSRLVHDKGLDLVADLVPRLAALRARLVVLGSGDPALEARFERLGEEQPDRVSVRIGWDPDQAHRLLAGGDVLLMPSRFEPCGLTQMQAMRYGTVPVVRATGGLADSVLDPGDEGLARGEGTGFVCHQDGAEALGEALRRAVALRAGDPAGWRRLQRAGMATDVGWDGAAAKYIELYRSL